MCVYNSIWPGQDVVVLLLPKSFFQPLHILQQELHGKDKSSVRSEFQLIILHNIIYYYQISDISYWLIIKALCSRIQVKRYLSMMVTLFMLMQCLALVERNATNTRVETALLKQCYYYWQD
jgi:hypothetical protein